MCDIYCFGKKGSPRCILVATRPLCQKLDNISLFSFKKPLSLLGVWCLLYIDPSSSSVWLVWWWHVVGTAET